MPDLKCHVACKPCNEGWMARLEDRAKPVLAPLIKDGQGGLSLATSN
jgi:hypothetical protein